MRHLLWPLFAILAAMMIVLVGQQDGSAGLNRVDLAPLAAEVLALVFVGALALTWFRARLSYAIESALLWGAIALLLGVGYSYRFALRAAADQVMAELMPVRAATRGRTIEIARGAGGNFGIVAQIHGERVPMVLDTGASSVVLTQEAAKAAGLPLEVLTYTVSIYTANGRARAAPVTLDSIAVGGIVEHAVPALVAQSHQLRTNLLGMSFLNRLDSWEVRGDKLVIRGYP